MREESLANSLPRRGRVSHSASYSGLPSAPLSAMSSRPNGKLGLEEKAIGASNGELIAEGGEEAQEFPYDTFCKKWSAVTCSYVPDGGLGIMMIAFSSRV